MKLTGLLFLMIISACFQLALGGIGTMKTNWVDNKCGYDSTAPTLDQRFAQIHLDYSNTVTSGTTYTVSNVTLTSQEGEPCKINIGGTWTDVTTLTGTSATGPIDVMNAN